ncbi:MAG: NADH-quinone oxidoreductase subunit J [Myxococcota bacterium]
MTAGILFWAFASAMIISALAVVLSANPLRSALYLIASLCCAAVLYVLLDASFVAAMQILVYAGAIMVLFVFVLMLLNLGERPRRASLSPSKLLGTAAIVYITTRIASEALHAKLGPGQIINSSVKNVGTLLLTDYLFGFEAISVLLLVAVVGAVLLGLKRLT